MKRNNLLYRAFLVLILLGILYVIAPGFWQDFWFDKFMHFLGGLSAGLFALWVWYVSGLLGRNVPNKKQAFLTALLWVMAVGLGWEWYEYVIGVSRITLNYPFDTFTDVVADFVGAVLAGLIGGQAKFYKHE